MCSWSARAYTSFPGIGFQLMVGSTGASTGTAITPVNVRRHSGSKSPDFTATDKTTTPISTASASVVYADALDVTRMVFEPKPAYRPVLGLGQVMNLRTTTPSFAATVYAVATLREIGKAVAN